VHRRFLHFTLLVLVLLSLSLIAGVGRAFAFGFAPHADFATGTGPWTVAVGDVNGDGRLDLVTANTAASTISVLLGNGDGTFAAKTDYATDVNPYCVVLGDVNGDGKLDVVTSNNAGTDVSVLLGNGDGTFAAKTDYAAGATTALMALGDFNGDGKLDIVTANYYPNTVSVLLGNGDGTFQPKVDYATGSHPMDVAVGDLNGDGKLDIVTCNRGTAADTVSVLLGNGDGTFAAKTDYACGANPWGVTLGDLNGDGRLDIVTSNSSADTVSVLLGNGDGTFAAKTDYAVGHNPIATVIIDLNGDGKPDLAVANTSSSTVSVLLGNGDGTFAAKADFVTGGNPYSIAAGDFNSDGKLDLAVANQGANTVNVLLGEFDTVPSGTLQIAGGSAATNTRVVSLDSDVADATEMRVRDAGATWGAWQTFVPQLSWVLPVGDGAKTVEVQYRNPVGGILLSDSILLDTTAPVTTDDAPTAWQNTVPVDVHLSSSDGTGSGVATTEYSTDKGVTWTVDSTVPVSSEGATTIRYRSIDAAGNVEQWQDFTVRIDTTAPTVTLYGADSSWHKTPVAVFVTASDGPDGSGVASLGCTIDGVWYDGPFFVISTDGDHTLVPGATDVAGNATSGVPTSHVMIDTHGPTTSGLAASVKKGKKATLKVTATDALSPTVDLTVKIKNAAGKVVKTLTATAQPTNATVNISFTCKLAVGTYKYVVYATDLAGNSQVKAGGNKLVVK
jgi:hypothetical protein